jgi:2-succinyl-6-hydroxy-2,4-cyclohexadiene-1-carboxylate synthase
VASRLTGHEIVTVDAPGHGGSSAIEADLADGASLLVDAAGRGTYVGYSMGARVCLHAALAHPDAVERLVLLSGTPGIEDPDERAARRAGDEALAASLEHDGLEAFLERWLALPMFAGLGSSADVEDRRRNTVAGLASSLRLAGTGSQEDLWPRLGELAMPVLLVTGSLDTKFCAIADRMAGLIPRATRATIDGAHHAAHLERPEAFATVLTDWLDAR